MARVSVTVNARRYDIACDDGQEEHVRRLAQEIDRRAGELVGNLGEVGDARLLLLVALLLCDELAEARAELRRWRERAEAPLAAAAARVATDDGDAGEDRLLELARRVAAVAQALAAADPQEEPTAPLEPTVRPAAALEPEAEGSSDPEPEPCGATSPSVGVSV